MVMSFDPKANSGLGGRKPGRVRRTFRNTTRQVIDLRGLRMTPGHLVLSENGTWLRIADVLRQDRAIMEDRKDGPVLVRARTGAVIGTDEDTLVTVVFEDREGLPHKAVVRAGDPQYGRATARWNARGLEPCPRIAAPKLYDCGGWQLDCFWRPALQRDPLARRHPIRQRAPARLGRVFGRRPLRALLDRRSQG